MQLTSTISFSSGFMLNRQPQYCFTLLLLRLGLVLRCLCENHNLLLLTAAWQELGSSLQSAQSHPLSQNQRSEMQLPLDSHRNCVGRHAVQQKRQRIFMSLMLMQKL
jgi:hypothetical protein